MVRPLWLAGVLGCSRGEVLFAGGAGARGIVESAGYEFVELPVLESAEFFRRVNRARFPYGAGDLRRYVRAELDLLESRGPALVVGDFRLSLSISCGLAGVPFANLCNAHWSPHYALRYPPPDMLIPRLLGPRLSSSLIMPMVFRRLARDFDRVAREFGMGTLSDLREVYTRGDWTLYPDVPGLAPTRGAPDSHRYLGPVLWEPDTPMPRWERLLDSSAKRAYVSMGSSGDRRVLGRVIEALLALGCEVLVTAEPADLRRGPGDGVFAAPMLPGIKAAAMCDIVVCHGGSGTVYQALSKARPVLGLTSNPDQQLVMNGIEHAGAGTMMPARRASFERVRREALRLLQSTDAKRAAHAAAAEIRAHDAARRFALFVQETTGAPAADREPLAAHTAF